VIRGEPTLGRDARAATLYSVGSMRDPDHEATIRFCGEAPRRRAHSGHGFKAMAVFGSPPPRIMISGCRQGGAGAIAPRFVLANSGRREVRSRQHDDALGGTSKQQICD
jgi:hypothetical protein